MFAIRARVGAQSRCRKDPTAVCVCVKDVSLHETKDVLHLVTSSELRDVETPAKYMCSGRFCSVFFLKTHILNGFLLKWEA